ncbi:MAG: class I SAM-dependent methyltransferase [bacterium]
MIKLIKNPWSIIDDFIIRPIVSYKFDKTYNISTSGEIEHKLLKAHDEISLYHATSYQAVPIIYLDVLFDLLQNYSPETHFIDIGCGKGRACFYACQKYKRVTGIDFSQNLVEDAQKNLKSFSGIIKGEITFELRDASLYDLPNEPSLIYLYNPFDEYILRKFIKRNMNHFLKYKSRIAYVNDVCHDLLVEHGFTRTVKYNARRRISIYSLEQRAN